MMPSEVQQMQRDITPCSKDQLEEGEMKMERVDCSEKTDTDV